MEIVGDSYNYDPNLPFYVNGNRCYVENENHFIPLYYHNGTDCGTFVVIPSKDNGLSSSVKLIAN